MFRRYQRVSPSGWTGVRGVLAALAATVLAAGVLVAQPAPAHASSVTAGFDHTLIVSDAEFYNGRAMSAAQVQSFLNQRVPRCEIGDRGKRPGQPGRSGYAIAQKCLRDFTVTTTSRSANAYCAAYRGASNESAAQIIAKVGQACGINQKTLLVLLEKEQSLVTHRVPTTRMFNFAMGWACPDSGPGNSPNCDPAAANFFTQVYRSAWQFKRYAVNPERFNFRAGQTAKVQWHPNASCGTSRFVIKNRATAGLYNYTPYRPNQAALKAGWGTGDSCSSYGNRNFFSFWKVWFGNPNSSLKYQVTGDIQKHFDRNGGVAAFGEPLQNRVYSSANGGGYAQRFERATIATSLATGKTYRLGTGPFHDRWTALGGPASAWGWLNGHALCGLADRGCRYPFQHGLASYSASTGVQFVPNAVQGVWSRYGYEAGRLGYPVEEAQQSSGGFVQFFQNGAVMVTADAQEYVLNRHLAEAWSGAGGGIKGLGLITGGAVRHEGGRYFTPFERGTLFLDGDRAVRFGSGPFLTEYTAGRQWENQWGWPLAPGTCNRATGECSMVFEKGIATYTPTGGVQFVSNALHDAWVNEGGVARLGHPVGPQTRHTETRFSQPFERGTIFVEGTRSVRFGNGPFLTEFTRSGGVAGAWGWPRAAGTCDRRTGICRMVFEHGEAFYSPKTGVQFLPTADVAAWDREGGMARLGLPTAAVQSHGDEMTSQSFEKGRLFIRSGAAVRFGNGPFLQEYDRTGGPSGPWGWPQLPGECGLPNGGCRMVFEHGTATYTPRGGVRFTQIG